MLILFIISYASILILYVGDVKINVHEKFYDFFVMNIYMHLGLHWGNIRDSMGAADVN